VKYFISNCVSPSLSRHPNESGLDGALHPHDRGRLRAPDRVVFARAIAGSSRRPSIFILACSFCHPSRAYIRGSKACGSKSRARNPPGLSGRSRAIAARKPHNLDRAVNGACAGRKIRCRRVRSSASPVIAVAAIGGVLGPDALQMAIDRCGHLALGDLGQGVPAKRRYPSPQFSPSLHGVHHISSVGRLSIVATRCDMGRFFVGSCSICGEYSIPPPTQILTSPLVQARLTITRRAIY
jgi:hypothetical protein